MTQRSQCCCFTELNICCGDRCSWEKKQKFASVVNFSIVLWSLLSQYLIKLHTGSEQMKKKYCYFQITFKGDNFFSSEIYLGKSIHCWSRNTFHNTLLSEGITIAHVQYRRVHAVWRSWLYLVTAMGQVLFQSCFFNLKPELYSLSSVILFWWWCLIVLHIEQKRLMKCLETVDYWLVLELKIP